MQDLTLEVGLVDHIEVDDTDAPNACGGQVHQERRTETTRADAEDGRSLELALTGHTHLVQNQVPTEPSDPSPVNRQIIESPGDAGDDGQDGGGLQRGVLPIQGADVVLTQIDVDEAAELSGVVAQVSRQTGMRRGEGVERFTDGVPVDVDTCGSVRKAEVGM